MKEAILINNASIETIELIIKESIDKAMKNEFYQKNINSKSAESNYLSRKQTAKILGISLPTLHKWTINGILKGYRIGNSVRYKSNEIENSLDMIVANKYKKV
jgi:excisionase family DNA binding protein